MSDRFMDRFKALTGHRPFPWQVDLYQRMCDGVHQIPSRCDIPTGLGKTSAIAVWLLAREFNPDLPRRLVYVVNRRTVVDQTTNEVQQIRENLAKIGMQQADLAISTLRGQFADNRQWSADPARPAVICGTVDMIGSRLLFSGYGVGFKARPLHAGFLGQDALLVHDEAHLEPAFQKLIETIQDEQRKERERHGDLPWPALRVMALSATARGHAGNGDATFGLKKADHEHPIVKQRIKASKSLRLHPCEDEKKKLAADVVERALQHEESGNAILVFLRSLEDAMTALASLEKKLPGRVAPLTGTMRGYERDQLVRSNPVFARFMPPGGRPEGMVPTQGTVYLVCTSAGEVGVNLSADHMVCDLSTFDSMAQRLGRVNRFGDREDTRVDVVYPESIDEKHPLTRARKATLTLLQRLNGDASPTALGNLPTAERHDAFAPEPTILPATDILFDAWALTTIKGKMPGRPPVEPYLHGIAEWQPPETHVAWRKEVDIITGPLLDKYPPSELLDDYPLKPHELLRDNSDRVFRQLETLAKRDADKPVWLIDQRDNVDVLTLEELTDKRNKDRINRCTVLLPPSTGGLSESGMLDGRSERADDIADIPASLPGARVRVWSDDPAYADKTDDMRRVRTIELSASEDDEDDEPRRWEWFDKLPEGGGRTAKKPVLWRTHVDDVVKRVTEIVNALELPDELKQAVILAAKLHDHGKRRERFQTTLGNRNYPATLLAKSGKQGARLPEPFRHEFASLLDAQVDEAFRKLSPDMQDLVLQLIAAHHGRGRPHFDLDEAFDSTPPAGVWPDEVATEVPRRYARLQRKYGRWGLAYLESLLRAADWAASANSSKVLDAKGNEVAL
jgi:CRISPR-associated endonuclease/helicase Cas3